MILSLCVCCADRPHLPFVAPAAKFALYPPSEVKLPADQQPPTGMPRIAWSNSGELFGYNWTATLDPEQYHGLQPGQVLPPEVVLDLRRAYYSAVSHVSAQPFSLCGVLICQCLDGAVCMVQMDDQVGKVMAALEASGFKDNTVVSFWGDQCAAIHSLGHFAS